MTQTQGRSEAFLYNSVSLARASVQPSITFTHNVNSSAYTFAPPGGAWKPPGAILATHYGTDDLRPHLVQPITPNYISCRNSSTALSKPQAQVPVVARSTTLDTHC